LVGSNTNLDSLETYQDVIIHKPTFGDVGYIGRPNSNLPNFTHWSSTYIPLEIIRLDPMPAEAWDEQPGKAAGNYSGNFRFNLYDLVVNGQNNDQDYLDLYFSDGTTNVLTRLANDSYYAHTQPINTPPASPTDAGGVYHYHGWKAGEVLNYANKVIGYSVDGFAIMGHGTYIFEPIFNGNRVTGHTGNINSFSLSDMRPSISGYKQRTDWLANRQSFNPNAPTNCAGCFHIDFEYDSSSTPNDKYVLDEYNMGYTALKHGDGQYSIEKVYVCTTDYPYTLHTTYFDRGTSYGPGGDNTGGDDTSEDENNEQPTDIYVSSGNHNSPYYEFYSDSAGNNQIPSFPLPNKTKYQFRRLNNQGYGHPFYISDKGRNQPSENLTFQGAGSHANGIKGNEKFTVDLSNHDGRQIWYYCTLHNNMKNTFS